MDRQMCLELMSMSVIHSKQSGVISASKQLKFLAPYQIHSKIKVPEFARPKSALVTCLKTDISKLLPSRSKCKVNTSTDIRPWSKANSPFSSRPNSAFSNRKKVLEKSGNGVVTKIPQMPETVSSLITEINHNYQINKYEDSEVCEVKEPNSAIQEYIALNPKESSVFATEVPSFIHERFPKRKVKHGQIRKSSTLVSTEFPKRQAKVNQKITVKPSYFHLKRRYYPVKFKLNHVPRYCTSPFHDSKYNSFNLDQQKLVHKIPIH